MSKQKEEALAFAKLHGFTISLETIERRTHYHATRGNVDIHAQGYASLSVRMRKHLESTGELEKKVFPSTESKAASLARDAQKFDRVPVPVLNWKAPELKEPIAQTSEDFRREYMPTFEGEGEATRRVLTSPGRYNWETSEGRWQGAQVNHNNLPKEGAAERQKRKTVSLAAMYGEGPEPAIKRLSGMPRELGMGFTGVEPKTVEPSKDTDNPQLLAYAYSIYKEAAVHFQYFDMSEMGTPYTGDTVMLFDVAQEKKGSWGIWHTLGFPLKIGFDSRAEALTYLRRRWPGKPGIEIRYHA